jgi:hypothetical protein
MFLIRSDTDRGEGAAIVMIGRKQTIATRLNKGFFNETRVDIVIKCISLRSNKKEQLVVDCKTA